MNAADLPRQGLLDGVPWSEVRDLMGPCPVRTAPAGHVVVGPGDPSERVWLVLAGQVGIHVHAPNTEPVVLLGAGEPVGELSAIDAGPRSAWVIAERTSRLVELDRGTFRDLLQRSHRTALNLLHLIVRRIRASDDAISRVEKERMRAERDRILDPLTQIHNRRWLDQHLPALLDEAHRQGWPLSIVMMDVDRFKVFNDTHGHPAGDRVLCEVADQLRRRFRLGDAVARYGGEEFIAILSGSDLQGAMLASERVRQVLAYTGIPLPEGGHARITVSIGVAEAQPGESMPSVVARADQALYRAKAEGRNRVVAA